MQADCTQIFLPKALIGKEGYLLGFNTRGFTFTIIWIENQKSIEQIEQDLLNWDKQQHIQQICGTQLQILGYAGQSNNEQQRDTWLQLNMSNNEIILNELMICNYKYKTNCTFILYDDLKNNQLVTYQNETERFLEGHLKTAIGLNPLVAFEHQLSELKIHHDNQESNDLDYSLIHINWITQILREYFNIQEQKNLSNNYYITYLQDQIIIKLMNIVMNIAAFQRIVFRSVLNIIQFKLFGKSIIDLGIFNYTTKQIVLKYELINKWEQLFLELKSNHQPLNLSVIINCYHTLFSGMLFFLSDMLLGALSLLLLYYNVSQLREFLHKYGSSIHIEVLSREVEWLMGFPAGLKTNKPLNIVFGQMIMYIIICWDHITTFLTPYENMMLRTIIVFGLFGLTFELALAIDIITLCTIHVYYIYKLLAVTYRQLWHITINCYRITKDKYINVERNRIEEYCFTWDRKILAMFLSFFLLMMFPTVSLYYFWFLFIVIFIYLVKSSLLMFQKFIARFPLFLLYSYYKLNLIPKMIDITINHINKPNVTISLNYKKVPITSIIKFNKLLKIKLNYKLVSLIKSIFIGEDIMVKRDNTQKKHHKSD